MRVAPPLRFFLAARHRDATVTVPHDETSAIVHVIESLGVPRTEFGEVLVNGEPTSAQGRPGAGDVLDVLPRPRPQRLARERFVLDVHLGSLARRMRLLGLDTAYGTTANDDELVAIAVREGRALLTKDRGILRRRALPVGAFVRGDRTDEQLADVLDRFAPALHPWSRCPACNGTLEPAAKPDVEDQLLPGTRRTYAEFSRCRACGRVYWRGAHSGRLTAIVAGATARGRPAQ